MRRAVAHLLLYLAKGDKTQLEESVEAANQLKPYLSRQENRYWHHYILAHESAERGRPYDFVGHVLDLWLGAVVPLETPYETLKALSLSEAPNSGFASSLPFLYENVARLIPGGEAHDIMPAGPDVDEIPFADWEQREGELAAVFLDFLRRVESGKR